MVKKLEDPGTEKTEKKSVDKDKKKPPKDDPVMKEAVAKRKKFVQKIVEAMRNQAWADQVITGKLRLDIASSIAAIRERCAPAILDEDKPISTADQMHLRGKYQALSDITFTLKHGGGPGVTSILNEAQQCEKDWKGENKLAYKTWPPAPDYLKEAEKLYAVKKAKTA